MLKSVSELGLGRGTVIMDMTAIRLLFAPGAITTTPHTPALPMATTDPAGSSVVSLSAPARGITATGVAVAGVAAATTAGVAMVA
jgi:hypothetical protein